MLGELLHDEEVLFSVWLTLKVAAVCLALHLITAVPAGSLGEVAEKRRFAGRSISL